MKGDLTVYPPNAFLPTFGNDQRIDFQHQISKRTSNHQKQEAMGKINWQKWQARFDNHTFMDRLGKTENLKSPCCKYTSTSTGCHRQINRHISRRQSRSSFMYTGVQCFSWTVNTLTWRIPKDLLHCLHTHWSSQH